MPGTPVRLGPWTGGLNTQNNPSTISDGEVADLFNMEVDIDGSLVSRPTFVADTVWVSVGDGYTLHLLGFFYATTGVPYLMLTDGQSKTYAYDGTTFTTVATTFAAAAFVQFNGQAWLTSPYGSSVAGGYWTPGGGFVSDANLPKGNVLLTHKYRLWVAVGQQSSYSSAVQSRLYYSNVLGDAAGLWTATPNFIDINAGDGQTIVGVTTYYNNLLIFRTSSIWTLNYNVSVTGDGQVTLLVPGIGLNSVDAFVGFENYVYFMFEDRAYQFINNRAVQINTKVPFILDNAVPTSAYGTSFAVSLLHERVVFSYYRTMYVYSTRMQTWSRWQLTDTAQAIGKILTADTANGLGYLGYDAVVFAQNSRERTSTGNETLFRVNELPPVPLDNQWNSVAWSPALGLFCAVASLLGSGNQVMTSPDGITWTVRTPAANNQWQSVVWSPEKALFVAVAYSGTGNRVMTSPNGITWTARTSAADNNWYSVAWSPALGLFCAVAFSGTGNRVMTSPDGITWTARTSAADNNWRSVAWSPALGLFVAVAASGTGNRVMTSPDGVTWTARTSAADNSWNSVTWSPSLALFVAVAGTGTGNRVMTSPDGVTWTARTSAADNQWYSVVWSPEKALFVAVAPTGIDNRVMTSSDGITWTIRTSATSGGESMTCVVRTKTYDFEDASVFKRLFWWGVDAIFRWKLNGKAVAVRVGSDTEVTTSYDLAGYDSDRRFVKMNKSLRFRQIYFELSFAANGTTMTLPFRLFGLTVYAKPKTSVSEGIE